MLSARDVRATMARIEPHVRRTRLIPSPRAGLWLKLENEQRSGAFKARGATAALTALPPGTAVVTHSSGNHGRALAEAAAHLGYSATVVVPDNALPHKVAAIRAAGARVEIVPVAQRASRADELVAEGLTLVPPFDHLDVMAGQGTVAMELVEQAEAAGLQVGRVWAPVGGGGLLSGIAVALTGTRIGVVGVEPELAGDFADSVRSGRHVAWSVSETARTVADGLRLPSVGDLPWQHLHTLGTGVVTVTEQQIVAALRWLDEVGVRAEPSGAVSVAGALAALPGPGVDVAVVSGGNRAPDQG